MQKHKFLNLGPKNFYLGVLGGNFKNLNSYLKSTPSNLCYCKVLFKHKKSLNLSPRIPDLGILGLEFENNIVIFEFVKFESRICLFAKFRTRMKMPKFEAINALFGYFWAGILKT